jgi:outer membrane protein TolC
MFSRWIIVFAGAFAAGCVAYVADDADANTVAAEAAQRSGGTFTFATALAAALRQNPELQALEAKARAAGAVTQPLEVQSEYRSDDEMLAVMLDPIALLGLGARGAAQGLADAAAAEAVAALAAGRWRVTAAVAEIFVMDTALRSLSVPDLAVDVAEFERAGLASPIAAEQVRAAQARAAAETFELAREAEANRAALRNLLGLPAGTPVELAPSDAEPLRQPQATDGAVLARPDLALATARFRVADAEFRAAVADQYPSLMLGPEFPLRGDPLELMAILRVPIGMAGRAEAARERREAARATLASAYVQASNGACTAERELAAAAAGETGAALSLRASTRELATARIALQVEIEGFDRYAKAAAMVVRDTMERRAATTAHVRARVQRAVAYGWPLTGSGS